MAMELRGARGEGFATIAADGRVLDSWFLRLRLVVEADKAATVRLALSPGEAHDVRLAGKLLSRLKSGSMLLADRGYDAD